MASNQSTDVMGLTVCNNELFVVRKMNPQVYVYNAHNLTPSRMIDVPGMTSPRGLASCNKALYISDQSLAGIYRVDISNNAVTRWMMTSGYEPRGLSVTPRSTLLVTVLITSNENQGVVMEYTSEGQLASQMIRLHKSIEQAWQTVELPNNQLIVCHGLSTTLQGVCQINTEGQIIKLYGRQKGPGAGQLDQPLSVAICYKTCRIYIADYGNNRIQVLDYNLAYAGEITQCGDHTTQAPYTLRHLTSPSCLCCDSSTYRLFVGEYNTCGGFTSIP